MGVVTGRSVLPHVSLGACLTVKSNDAAEDVM